MTNAIGSRISVPYSGRGHSLGHPTNNAQSGKQLARAYGRCTCEDPAKEHATRHKSCCCCLLLWLPQRKLAPARSQPPQPEDVEIQVMISPHRRAPARLAPVLIFVGLACGVSVPVRAGMSIEGGPDALRLEANGASLEDVLAALRDQFNL